MSPLVIVEISRVFVKTNIGFKIPRISHFKFKSNYLKNYKLCLNFLFQFWILHQILNILKEKIIVIANAFPKLQTVKNLVWPLPKKRSSRTRFDSQHVKVSQIYAKSLWEQFYHVFSSFSENLIWKMSPLVISEILEVFVNTLTADDKYPVQDCENLPLLIQMQLSEKRKTFSEFFVPFLDSTSNFKHFETKDDCQS